MGGKWKKEKITSKYLYFDATMDKYEYPIHIAESPSELAEMLGVSRNAIYSAINQAEKRGGKCRYHKALKDDEEEGGKMRKKHEVGADVYGIEAMREQEAVKRWEIETFRQRLKVGDKLTVKLPYEDGALWYGNAAFGRWVTHEYAVCEKHPHVVVLSEKVGKISEKSAIDYNKLYLLIRRNGGGKWKA